MYGVCTHIERTICGRVHKNRLNRIVENEAESSRRTCPRRGGFALAHVFVTINTSRVKHARAVQFREFIAFKRDRKRSFDTRRDREQRPFIRVQLGHATPYYL